MSNIVKSDSSWTPFSCEAPSHFALIVVTTALCLLALHFTRKLALTMIGNISSSIFLLYSMVENLRSKQVISMKFHLFPASFIHPPS